MRKSRLLTFFFGMWPGAGQMYLGYMKRGLSLMTIFFTVISLSMFFRIDFTLILLPIIWFYAFFDALNLRMQTYDERFRPLDDYIFHMDSIMGADWKRFLSKRHLFIGFGCILLGLYLILNNIIAPLIHRLLGFWILDFLRFVPSLLLSLGIILFGLYLLRGGMKQIESKFTEDDYKEYTGNTSKQNHTYTQNNTNSQAYRSAQTQANTAPPPSYKSDTRVNYDIPKNTIPPEPKLKMPNVEGFIPPEPKLKMPNVEGFIPPEPKLEMPNVEGFIPPEPKLEMPNVEGFIPPEPKLEMPNVEGFIPPEPKLEMPNVEEFKPEEPKA